MKRFGLPSLEDLRVFEVVARYGSIRAAADELALTHGAVSRRVSKLADDLGILLLEADGRGVRLTADGLILAQSATEAIALVTHTIKSITTVQTTQPIVLSCERSLAMKWLIPRLAIFQKQYPDIELHLSVGGGSIDFQRERVTLALRRLDFAIQPNWRVEKIMPEQIGPVMPAAMTQTFEQGDYVALGTKTRPDAWKTWGALNPTMSRPRTVRYFDHHFLMLEAAINGLGVAMCPKVIAMDGIQAGYLTAPLGFVVDGSEYALIHPSSVSDNPGLVALERWLCLQAKELKL